MLLAAATQRIAKSRGIDEPQAREKTIKSIQEAVAYLFGLSVEELKQEGSRRAVAAPRQIAIYLAKQMTDASLCEIGRQFGYKHQSTVKYSISKIEGRRLTNADLNHVIKDLSQHLTQPNNRALLR